MSLQKIDIFNIRNISRQTIYPAPTFNFIYGNNGSGKSAFIEAIYLLGRAKSFRTSSLKSVITFNHSELVVSAQVNQKTHQPLHLGIRVDGKSIDIHKNQRPTLKRSDLAYTLPLQIIHPKSYELLDSGGQIRREFMDWGIFNHERAYLDIWKNYKKILAHRNALLKLGAVNQLNVWNQELMSYGTMVQQYRDEYIFKFKPVFFQVTRDFFPLPDFDLSLFAGWDENLSLLNALELDVDRDIRDGFTHSGPHRSDFHLLIEKKLVKDVVSRGQLKLLVVCLKLAQIALVNKESDFFSCILIDDFAAELDLINRRKILTFLDIMGCQVFITATEKEEFGDLSPFKHKMFHVEHGQFKEV